jgi:hypothetical protein
MSYILEGLKKLEQKSRQEKSPPDLLTFREENSQRAKRLILWPYLLFTALLLNVGIILWWIGPWPSGQRPSWSPLSVPGPTVKTVKPAPAENKYQRTPGSSKEPPPLRDSTTTPQSPDLEKTKESKSPVVKKNQASENTPAPNSPEPRSSVIHKVVEDGRILKLSELSSEIKKSLPAIKMSVHFYSPDKQASFVTINDRTLHEGELLSEDLRVMEINPEGTVLKYRNHLFLVGLNENL